MGRRRGGEILLASGDGGKELAGEGEGEEGIADSGLVRSLCSAY